MGKLLEELKRRKVFRVAAVYAVVAWVLIQVADTVLPALQMPQWTVSFVTVLFILGFPIALILAWAYESSPSGIIPDHVQNSSSTKPSSAQPINYLILAIVLLVAGFQVADRFLLGAPQEANNNSASGTANSSAAVMRSSITLDQSFRRNPNYGFSVGVEVNNQGTQLAYQVAAGENAARIFSRNFATQESSLVSESFITPTFLPDGSSIAGVNYSDNLEIQSISGDTTQQFPLDWGYSTTSWISDSELLYTSGGVRGINRKSLLADADIQLTQPEERDYHFSPHVLPGANAFLYVNSGTGSNNNTPDIYLQRFDSGGSEKILLNAFRPQYAQSGHIVFVRSNDLWAVPFDSNSLEITGRQVRVIEGVESFPQSYNSVYDFSENGRLVYLPGNEVRGLSSGFNWIDRKGNREAISLPTGSYTDPELSPDNKLLAVTVTESNGSTDIWVYDLERETFARRTFSGNTKTPKWSPDGSKLAYMSVDEGIWQINADGSGQAEQLTADETARPDSFAVSGDVLLYLAGDVGFADLKALNFRDGVWLSSTILSSESNYFAASLSPDGRWLSYTSNEDGQTHIYVRPYPDIGNGKWQVSIGRGGIESKWSADGKELYYRIGSDLLSVQIDTENGFSSSVPQIVASGFRGPFRDPPYYAVTNDGARFIQYLASDSIGTAEETGTATLMVVENWFEELKQLAPPDPQ